jgi:hypothetical protein
MAGTTTNFAIPYPSVTDYVTDGATAMRSIADQVDAVLFTGSSSGNLLINGAMQVSQRSAVGTAVTGITASGYYTADRWNTFANTLGTWTQTTIADAPTGSGFRNSLKLACTTADASPAAGDYLILQQRIEGQNLQAVRKGTASAQTLTLSFWVKSFQTGIFIVELEDTDNTRSCSKSYTINVSNTWELKTVTFPADVTGAFDNDENSSLRVNWWLGAGTTFTSGTLATTWGATVSANRAVGQTNLASSTSNTFFVTGTQLTVGSVATPFEFKSFGETLRDCQRYYEKSYIMTTAIGTATEVNAIMNRYGSFTGVLHANGSFQQVKRALPTFRPYSTAAGTADAITVVGWGDTIYGAVVGTHKVQAGVGTVTGTGVQFQYTADAEL